MIAQIPRHVMNFMTSSTKIFEILDEEIDVKDDEKPESFEINGDIDINNVSFGYDSGKEVLHKIDVHIKKGEFIGIVAKLKRKVAQSCEKVYKKRLIKV